VNIARRTDSSVRARVPSMAEQDVQPDDTNPTLELLGICLTGIGQQSTRLRSRAFQAMNDDFGGRAPLFNTTIRYVESAAHDVREYGKAPHELEVLVAQAEPFWKRLRSKSTAPVVAASAGSLAQDYQSLTQEILGRLVEAEQTLAQQQQESGR